jgi:hypothetical protein
MNLIHGTSWSSTGLVLGLDLAMKATALLVLVLLIQNALRHRRASLGSAIGNAGLIGLLMLPFAALGLPSMPIACFPVRAIAPGPEAALSIPENDRPLSLPEESIPLSSAADTPQIESGLSGCKYLCVIELWNYSSPLMGLLSERASFIGVFSNRETLKICKISCNECSTFSSLRMMATST